MRFNNLTVARFVAAALVYLHHSTPLDYSGGSRLLHQFSVNGFSGVSFFFVLSGFVLASSSLDRLGTFSPREIGTFYWKRIARIVPLWLLLSLPFILGAIKAGNPGLYPFLTFTQAWFADANITFAILPVAWTLSVEMSFYAIFPIVALLLGRVRWRYTGVILLGGGVLVSGVGAIYFVQHPELANLGWTATDGPHRWLYTFPLARLGEFLAGIGAYLLIARGVIGMRRWPTVLATAGCMAVLVGVMATLPIGGAWFVFPYAAIFAVLVPLLARLDTLGITVTFRPLLLLGEASFALYLVHQSYMMAMVRDDVLEAAGNLAFAKIFTFVLAVVISVGLFTAIEDPARRLLTRLPSRR